MENRFIETSLGRISVAIDGTGAGEPLVFMHGIFMDKSLWRRFDSQLTGRRHIYIDMPAHGSSSNVEEAWNLDDCVEMFMQVLDKLVIERCIAIGHSWGGMTALRASHRYPSRFASLGLFNMPFKQVTGMNKASAMIQKGLTAFPRFYATQAAKAIYSSNLLVEHPELITDLRSNLASRPPKQLRKVIDAVIIKANDSSNMLKNLSVPALAIVGKTDKVCSAPPNIETITVPGGHVSPYEAPEEMPGILRKIITASMRA